MFGGHVGADDVDAVETRLFLDPVDPALPGEMTITDLHGKVLGHFLAVQHRADRQADFSGAAQGSPSAPNLRLDPSKLALGRRQEILALAPTFDREIVIAADDQPFTRE